MSHQVLENIATADAAFRAAGKTPEELFVSAAQALEEFQVDTSKLANREQRTVELKNGTLDELLFDFLNELIFLKDAEELVFSKFDIEIKTPDPSHYSKAKAKEEGSRPADSPTRRVEKSKPDGFSSAERGSYTLVATLTGEKLDPSRHELRVDVKAVTKHRFEVKETGEGYEATVVLDI